MKNFYLLFAGVLLAAGQLVSCSTDDVKDIPEDSQEQYYAIEDRAFGEYLLYNCTRTDDNALPAGTAVERDGIIYLDTYIAAGVENLYLVKNDTQVSKLEKAGVATAAVKIANLDGLQYFRSLKTLKITSNLVSRMDLEQLAELETLEMNFNQMTALDLSHNTRLVRFRYGGNADGETATKLSEISFENLGAIEHIYLKNQNIGAGGFTLPANTSALAEIDLSGNPGAPFAIPAELYARLTTRNGVIAETGSEPEPDPTENLYELTDAAFAEYLIYNAEQGDLPEGIVTSADGKYLLDKSLAAQVETLNVAKTSSAKKKLEEAGVATANTPIASADGLQFFSALTAFTATSNQFTEPLPLSSLPALETLQINTAYVGELDLSGNPALKTLNCQGSTKSGATLLTEIDLSHNTRLESLNLKNNDLSAIDLSLNTALTSVDLSGNPGAPFTISKKLYDQLTTAEGVVAETDSEPEPDPTENLYELTDAAFAEYLIYNAEQGDLPEGIVTSADGKYLLDKSLAAQVETLNVAKTSSAKKKLEEAGVATANTPIASADGLQFFSALTAFTATSNQFTEPLPLSSLPALETLQINTAYVGELDLSGNPALKTLNCQGSTKSGATLLTEIDLSHNTRLESLNLKNNDLSAIDLSLNTALTSVDLSGNPGAPFAIPGDIYDNLTLASGVERAE